MANQQMNTAASSSMFNSSSSSDSLKKYDVFLSFRGEDTRNNFTSHLYDALVQKKVETYIDYDLERGDEISPALIRAIEESHASIIIFSENYASSKWCLEELNKILECKKYHKQIVIPVFYKVDPSHVRKQIGSYKQALAKHKKYMRHNKDKVHKWKAALTEAANLAGWTWNSKTDRTESELVKDVVGDVLKKLKLRYPFELKGLVGIEENYSEIESLLETGSSEVRIIGLWGMGGIGKTTIAAALYAKLFSLFEGHCFLSNVREESAKKGLDALRNKLFSDLLNEENLNLNTPKVVSNFVMTRLRRTKVFIVLDDVATSKQLEDLIIDYDCLRSGSRVIVTTRNKHVLNQFHEIYEVKQLNYHDSLKLFCANAFNEKHPKNGYEELFKGVIAYCKGTPLALKVLGARLRGRSKEVWESELRKLKKNSDLEIQNVLRLSYDDLDRTQKDIFLDIAFFYKGKYKDHVTSLLEACEFFPASGIQVLLDRALITISKTNRIEMHDLIQEMGWEIVHQESSKDPGRRSRLWYPEEVCDVLKYNQGTEVVEGIRLDVSKIGDLHLNYDSFVKMTNLRFLEFYSLCSIESCYAYLPNGLVSLSDKLRYLHWPQYCLKSLPSTFCAKRLVEFHMPNSNLEKLWDGVQDLENLKTINLARSKHLVKVPDLSMALNLEEVSLDWCGNLRQVHPSILSLPKLKILYLRYCTQIGSLKTKIHLKSLKTLNLECCSSLIEFSVTSEKMEYLNLKGTGIHELPSSFLHNRKLRHLDLNACENLKIDWKKFFDDRGMKSLTKLILSRCKQLDASTLWFILDGVRSLTRLYLRNCCNLQALPDNIGLLSSLKRLDLSGSNVESLPANIKNLSMLTKLDIDDCQKLVFVPELPPSIQVLSAKYCTSLEVVFNLNSVEIVGSLPSLRKLYLSYCCSLQILPDSIGLLSSLESLDLSGSNFESLPACIKNLSKLKKLDLNDCRKLLFVPKLPLSLQVLATNHCTSLEIIFNLNSVEIVDGLPSLIELYLSNCCNLQILPDSIGLLSSLEFLDLSRTNVMSLSPNIKKLSKLKVLALDNCTKLGFLPYLPPSLLQLSAINCISLDTNFTQMLMLQHHLLSISYPPKYFESIFDWVFDNFDYAFFPGTNVLDLFTHTRETSITIPYLPLSNLCGFIFCIILSESISNAEKLDAYCFIHQNGVIDSYESNRNLGYYVDFTSDHVVLWYVDIIDLHKEKSVVNDHYSNISFEFKTSQSYKGKKSGEGIKGCGVLPVYATGLELSLTGITKDVISTWIRCSF